MVTSTIYLHFLIRLHWIPLLRQRFTNQWHVSAVWRENVTPSFFLVDFPPSFHSRMSLESPVISVIQLTVRVPRRKWNCQRLRMLWTHFRHTHSVHKHRTLGIRWFKCQNSNAIRFFLRVEHLVVCALAGASGATVRGESAARAAWAAPDGRVRDLLSYSLREILLCELWTESTTSKSTIPAVVLSPNWLEVKWLYILSEQ